jgi:hypothetical protein
MADLLAGSVIRALDTPPTQPATDNSDIINFTNTTFAAGSPVVGVAFTAPTSGRVLVLWRARIEASTSGYALISAAVRTGSTINAGTLVSASSLDEALETGNLVAGQSRFQAGTWRVVTGLTPGSAYNAVVEHIILTGGNGNIYTRAISVMPLA